MDSAVLLAEVPAEEGAPCCGRTVLPCTVADSTQQVPRSERDMADTKHETGDGWAAGNPTQRYDDIVVGRRCGCVLFLRPRGALVTWFC